MTLSMCVPEKNHKPLGKTLFLKLLMSLFLKEHRTLSDPPILPSVDFNPISFCQSQSPQRILIGIRSVKTLTYVYICLHLPCSQKDFSWLIRT